MSQHYMSALPTKRIAGFDSTAQGQILFSPNGDARGGDPATWLHMWSNVMFQVMIELKMWLLYPFLNILRKPTMIVTTASWMSDLDCSSMTPERRRWGWGMLGMPCQSRKSFYLFCQSSIPSKLFVARQILRNLQEMKHIQLVKKYRDRRGVPKVVEPSTHYHSMMVNFC